MLRLTNSEMSTFRRCKRKWYFGSYLSLKDAEEPAGNPLAIGSRVHNALAELYAPGASGDPVAAVRASVLEDIEKYPDWEVQLRKDEDLCAAMVEGYVQWLEETGADSDLKVIAAETKLEAPLFEDRDDVTLLSKIDTRVERVSTGHRLALEFKTVGDLTSPLPTLQLDTQLLTEHLTEFLVLRGLHGDEAASQRARGVLYRMLRKVKRTASAKPPFYGEEEVEHNLEELRNHWRHVAAIAAEIASATARLDAGESHHTVAYPSPRASCSWECRFLAACKLANAGADLEGYLGDNYRRVDPLERYENVTQVDE